jgi:hypothetical protein
MNLRQTYLDAAEYVRVHGLSNDVNHDGQPRCFSGAIQSVTNHKRQDIAIAKLADVIGWNSYPYPVRAGWTNRDAIAAFEIAADLATP